MIRPTPFKQSLSSSAHFAAPPTNVLEQLCTKGQLKHALNSLDHLQSQGIFVDYHAYDSLLRACATFKALEDARRVHAHIVKSQFDQSLGEGLFIMYSKCDSLQDAKTMFDKSPKQSVVSCNAMIMAFAKGGCLDEACRMFDAMPAKSVGSWNTMMAAFIKHGQSRDALELFWHMLTKDIEPNKITFISILEACTTPAFLADGKRIHEHIIDCGLEMDVSVGTALINMYGKCESLDESRRVFDQMHDRNVVSWNSMIAAYAKHGKSTQAIELFHQMAKGGMKANKLTFINVLSACATPPCLVQGKLIHDCIPESLLASDVMMGTALISMYSKCGSLNGAKQVFERMLVRDMPTCNAMLSAYVNCGQKREALELFQQMHQQGFAPDKFTLSCILTLCASTAALAEGMLIHAMIIEKDFDSDNIVLTTLVRMYAECGSINNAQKLFDKVPKHNVVSWTALITGYVHDGNHMKALQLLQQMYNGGIIPNSITFTSALSACASLADCKLVHTSILQSGYVTDSIMDNALLHTYLKLGSLNDAHTIFDRMPERNEEAWVGIVTAHIEHNNCKEAFRLFQQMCQEGVRSSKAAFLISLLNACVSEAALEQGKLVHAHIVQNKIEMECVVGTALVNMYAKCGSLDQAHAVFDKLPVRNVVSWTSMIAAYVKYGFGKKALQLFQEMRQEGVNPNKVTFVNVLNACTSTATLVQGKLIHAQIVDSELDKDIIVGTALVKMYGMCGSLDEAWEVFERVPVRDVILWTAIIIAHAWHRTGRKAVQLFEDMYKEGIMPDKVSFLSFLDACTSLAVLDDGMFIHASIVDTGIAEDIEIATALVNMYIACGRLDDACTVLTKGPDKNVSLWNIIIGAYAWNGDGEKAVHCVQKMLEHGVKPDEFTYMNLISTCNRAVLCEEGHPCLDPGNQGHGTTPMGEHYVRVVKLLEQAGLLPEAKDLMNRLHHQPCAVT